jgi:hypothetical protein
MSYLHINSYDALEAVAYGLLGVFISGSLLLVGYIVVSVVEEWSYAKKQPAPDHADNAADHDSMGADVVRTRPRRVSLSPWIK